MKKRVVVLLSAFMTAAAASQARELPRGAFLAGSDQLSSQQAGVATTLFDSTRCYYGCDGTLSQCLAQDPPSPAAVRIAAFIVRRVRAGVAPDAIRRQLQNRALSAHPARVYDVDVQGLEPRGDPQAALKVVVYADFECPYCQAAATALKQIVAERPHGVAVYFKHFPIAAHAHAMAAATAAVAAERQGKFWAIHDLLFASFDAITDDKIHDLAAGLGLDMPRFERDRADSTTVNRIRAEKRQGISFGVRSTPGIFVDGKLYHGPKTYEDLEDRLEEELEIMALPPARP